MMFKNSSVDKKRDLPWIDRFYIRETPIKSKISQLVSIYLLQCYTVYKNLVKYNSQKIIRYSPVKKECNLSWKNGFPLSESSISQRISTSDSRSKRSGYYSEKSGWMTGRNQSNS